MDHYILERYNRPALEFDGEILAGASTHQEGDERWQEVRIYRTETGKYVTEMIGRSLVEGETDIIQVYVFDNPADVRNGLYRRGGDRRFLTDTAYNVLVEAAEKDPGIVVIDSERI